MESSIGQRDEKRTTTFPSVSPQISPDIACPIPYFGNDKWYFDLSGIKLYFNQVWF
jgi:hypothetical protein